ERCGFGDETNANPNEIQEHLSARLDDGAVSGELCDTIWVAVDDLPRRRTGLPMTIWLSTQPPFRSGLLMTLWM
ncbi:hypothetical protein M8C21_032379, partial [Ambrosia artemisiifolia]